MSNSAQSSSDGIGLCTLLTVAFVVLKLCDVIDWSWWWVVSPVWIPLAAVLGVFAVIGAILLFMAALEKIFTR